MVIPDTISYIIKKMFRYIKLFIDIISQACQEFLLLNGHSVTQKMFILKKNKVRPIHCITHLRHGALKQ